MTETEDPKELTGTFSPLEAAENSNERMGEQLIIKVPYSGTVRAVPCHPDGEDNYLLGWVILD